MKSMIVLCLLIAFVFCTDPGPDRIQKSLEDLKESLMELGKTYSEVVDKQGENLQKDGASLGEEYKEEIEKIKQEFTDEINSIVSDVKKFGEKYEERTESDKQDLVDDFKKIVKKFGKDYIIKKAFSLLDLVKLYKKYGRYIERDMRSLGRDFEDVKESAEKIMKDFEAIAASLTAQFGNTTFGRMLANKKETKND